MVDLYYLNCSTGQRKSMISTGQGKSMISTGQGKSMISTGQGKCLIQRVWYKGFFPTFFQYMFFKHIMTSIFILDNITSTN